MNIDVKDATTRKLMSIPREVVEAMTRPEYVLKNVVPQVMSRGNFYKEASKSLDAELLSEDFLDLKVAYRVRGDHDNYLMSYLINEKFIREVELDEETIKENARQNVIGNTSVKQVREVIDDLSEEEIEDSENVEMYVINGGQAYGAGVMIYEDFMSSVLNGIKQDTDFYILPASIHELIVVPSSVKCTKDELRGIIAQVNSTVVREEDRLSNELYYWDSKTGKISVEVRE